jgi:hypothetical protein
MELFHATNDIDSAAARRAVVDGGWLEKIRFRNVFYAEVKADFDARGGARLPALWDGARLHQGLDQVLLALSALAE